MNTYYQADYLLEKNKGAKNYFSVISRKGNRKTIFQKSRILHP